jgi:pimeloyl-ACP methyl ester carboxylesterase
MKKILAIPLGVLVLIVGVWYGIPQQKGIAEAYPPHSVDVWWAKGEPREDTSVRNFRIKVEDDMLQDLKARLSATRFFEGVTGGNDWERGTPQQFMKELVQYWQNTFNWTAQVAKINKFDQFVTNINGLDIHFIHVKANRENKCVKKSIPLLLLHGWPGSFVEFLEVIQLLSDPECGDANTWNGLAYDLVIPSLPGYGFSGAPTKPGMNAPAIAIIVAKLMNRLGYSQYVAQGGDYGSFIAKMLPIYDSEHCVGIHLNMYLASTPLLKAAYQLPIEYFFPNTFFNGHDRRKYFPSRLHQLLTETGYMHLQATRPYTLAQGLTDSPAGLAAYIIEKFYHWADVRGDIHNTFTKDQLLTNVMIYWTTNSISSSVNYYYEIVRDIYFMDALTREQTTKPTALMDLYTELAISNPPFPWTSHIFTNIAQQTQYESGGHFAAMEQPELFSKDLLMFGKVLVKENYFQ